LVPRVVSAEVAHKLVKDFTSRALPTQAAEVSRVDCRGVAEARLAEEVAEAAVVVLLAGLVMQARREALTAPLAAETRRG